MTEKLEVLQLKPEELIQYQNFFQQQGQALAEVGRITMEYQAALAQGKEVINRITQMREQWIIKALAARGVNPSTGAWQIDPQTGHILNTSKLRVADA